MLEIKTCWLGSRTGDMKVFRYSKQLLSRTVSILRSKVDGMNLYLRLQLKSDWTHQGVYEVAVIKLFLNNSIPSCLFWPCRGVFGL